MRECVPTAAIPEGKEIIMFLLIYYFFTDSVTNVS